MDKFLAGTASAEEKEALINYYQSFQQQQSWDTAELGKRLDTEKKLLARLQNAVQSEQAIVVPVAKTIKWGWWAAACCIALLITAVWLFGDEVKNALYPVKMVQVITPRGARKNIQLADGTQIWLEGGSAISYPEKFRDNMREITLRGEAFFEVSADEKHPFVIHTPLVSTKVLGTSFNIEAYDTSRVEVVVVSGKVMLNAETKGGEGREQLILHKNEKAVYDSSVKGFDVKKAPDAKDYELRKNGLFVYKGTRVLSIIKDLEAAYNTPIVIKGELLQCTFYGDFNAMDNVEKALNLIAITLNATVKKMPDNKGYIIVDGGCQ